MASCLQFILLIGSPAFRGMQEIAVGISNMQCLCFIYGPNLRVKLCHDGWGRGFDLCDAARLGVLVKGMPCVASVITCPQPPG